MRAPPCEAKSDARATRVIEGACLLLKVPFGQWRYAWDEKLNFHSEQFAEFARFGGLVLGCIEADFSE